MTNEIPLYLGLEKNERERLIEDVKASFAQAAAALSGDKDTVAPDVGSASTEIVEVPQSSDLVGIDPSVYRQINGALRADKQHLMFYGPPGTGKTTLAQHVARTLHSAYTMITGSADWTSQDVIGGYQPVGEGKVQFIPGVLIQNFDRPLIIDELNRCDIDKVIGPLFTVLSEQETTLPYRTDISEAGSAAYVILPKPKSDAAEHEFAPKPAWRILATINSIDKAALYQMSYALSRRFGWIYVDVPENLEDFLIEVMRKWSMIGVEEQSTEQVPLARLWQVVNGARVVGPAPILDMLTTIQGVDAGVPLLVKPQGEQGSVYLDGFYMYVLPMLDGISMRQAGEVAQGIADALGLREGSREARVLADRLVGMTV
ncbi:MAG: AAA family ATPase [Gemmatimonadetes bacterium]|nr:AAA family ATPase [Gemmatimonadota bacterium]